MATVRFKASNDQLDAADEAISAASTSRQGYVQPLRLVITSLEAQRLEFALDLGCAGDPLSYELLSATILRGRDTIYRIILAKGELERDMVALAAARRLLDAVESHTRLTYHILQMQLAHAPISTELVARVPSWDAVMQHHGAYILAIEGILPRYE